MRAAWVPESTAFCKVMFRDTLNEDNFFEASVPKVKIAVPTEGFGNDRYGLLGWSSSKSDPGQGTATYTVSMNVSGNATLWSVYKKLSTEFKLVYHGNG